MSSVGNEKVVPPASFPELIGRVTIAYNQVQFLLTILFTQVLWGDRELAKAMFDALNSDRGQRDIIRAAASVTLAPHPALHARASALLDRANDISGLRNAAVHTFWDQDLVSGQFIPVPGSRASKRLEELPSQQFEKVLLELSALYDDLISLAEDVGLTLALHDRFQTRPE